MRDTREGSAASGGPLVAGKERVSAGRVGCAVVGGGDGSSEKLKLKVVGSKRENKRRLVLSDSESDDCLVSPHRQKAAARPQSVDVKGNGHGAGKKEFEGFIDNGRRSGILAKGSMQKDFAKCRQDGGIDLKSAGRLGRDRKRSREASENGFEVDEVSLKKIKMEPLKCGRRKGGEIDAERVRLESVRFGVGKALVRASHLPGPRQVTADEEGDESLDRKRIQAHINGSRHLEAGKSSYSEHSNKKVYGLLKQNISSPNAHQYSVSSDGKSLRLQGKGGVLRLLPNNKKFSGQSTFYVKEESDESRKYPVSSGGAFESIFSEGGKCIKKPCSSITDESGKSPQSSRGADQCKRQLSLSKDRKSVKKAIYSSIRKETKKSPGPSDCRDHIVLKRLPLYKDRKSLKKQVYSSTKEERIEGPQHSVGAVKIKLKQPSFSEDAVSLKKSGSCISEGTRKCQGHSSRAFTLSEDRKSLKKPGYSSIQGKSPTKDKGHALKKEAGKLSRQKDSKNADTFCRRTAVKDRGAGKFVTETPLSPENNMTSEKVSRSTEKQKLRDHIKGMLLNAGWKIEMRPRRGRNYEDAVYVSPQGTGYWSITKAYSVLQEQFHKKDEMGNEKGEELHDQLSKATSTNACDQFSAIPLNMLNILKRKVVQKRRRRIEDDQERDNGKRLTSSKSTKNKEKTAITKKRISENTFAGSSKKRHKSGRGCALLARTSNTEADSDDDGYVPYPGKRSVLAWMIDSGTVPANGKVKYMNKRRTRTMLEGLITRDGIHCSCCSKILTVSKFEIHAGSKLNRPHENILVEESGSSLLQCQLDAWKRQNESDRHGFHLIDITDDDPNDDTCGICGDGGDLICCDSCPSTFHLSCLGIQMLPPGDWHCTNCLCRFCAMANSNGDNSVTGSLLLTCGQCEGKYHQACTGELDVSPLTANSLSLSFCGEDCKMLFEHLQDLLGVKNDLEAGFSWTLVRRFNDESLISCSNLAQRAECNSKIAVAFAVMNECFLPVIDRRSGINLLHNVLYNRGSNFSRLSYGGFYTFILERGDEIISAASIRIRGTQVAEMPFIGTRDMYRRQGMCRRLLNVIEETLGALKIEKLVIPAISELMHTWTVVFGFKPLEYSDKKEMKSMNLLVFPDTGLLQKPLMRLGSITSKKGGLASIENYTTTVSNGSPDPCASDKGIVSCSLEIKDEIGIERHSLPSPCNSVHATTESSNGFYQSPDAPDSPCRSDSESLRCKPLETATDPDGASSVDGNVGYHDEACEGSILCENSHVELKNQLPCDVPARKDAEVCSQNDRTDSHVPIVDKLSIQHASDLITKYCHTSVFQNVSEMTLRTKSGFTASLSEFGSKETHHNNSEVENESSQSPLLHDTPALDVASVLDIHNEKGEVSVLADTFCDSHQISEASRVSTDMPCADCFEHNLDRFDNDALHGTDKVVVEATIIKSDVCAFHKDPHSCTSEGSASRVEITDQVNACEDVCDISEITNHHECPQSEDGLQVSDHYPCQGKELPQGSPDVCCDATLSSAPKTSLKCDGDNNACVPSIFSSNVHSTNEALQIAYEMNNERPVRSHVLDESPHAASEYDLPVPHGHRNPESQNMSLSHNSSDASHVPSLDTCKQFA